MLGNISFTGNHGAFASTLPLLGRGHQNTVFLHVAQSETLKVFTGLAILNPTQEPASVTVRVFDQSGMQAGVRQLSIQPGRRFVDLLNSASLFGPDFQQVRGHFQVESSIPVVSFALFGDSGLNFLSAIEGQRSLAPDQ